MHNVPILFLFIWHVAQIAIIWYSLREVIYMAYKDKAAKTAYQNKFIAEAYDRINLTLPKGRKEEIKAHAESRGESVNGFINRAIENQIERDRDG